MRAFCPSLLCAIAQSHDRQGRPCAAHVFKDPGTEAFAASLATLVRAMERSFGEQGKKSLKIAIGCTGGQHRSVAVVETVAKALRAADVDLAVHHRELGQTL